MLREFIYHAKSVKNVTITLKMYMVSMEEGMCSSKTGMQMNIENIDD